MLKFLGCLILMGLAVILFAGISLRVLLGRLLGFGPRRRPASPNPRPHENSQANRKKTASGNAPKGSRSGRKIFSADEGEYVDYEDVR